MAIRVLLLDDDPAFRRELEAELRRLGHEAASFANWFEALDYVEQAPSLDSMVTELALGDGPRERGLVGPSHDGAQPPP